MLHFVIESKPAVLDSSQKSRTETYMSSREWLDKYGLRPKKLGFYDILAGVAFKHQDGVVDLKCPPRDMHQTDAVRFYLINIFISINTVFYVFQE